MEFPGRVLHIRDSACVQYMCVYTYMYLHVNDWHTDCLERPVRERRGSGDSSNTPSAGYATLSK